MPVFGQKREEKIKNLQELPAPMSKPDEVSTAPGYNFANINLEQKKKPHNIQINNKAKQPKVTPNVKYTEKQRFRRYKTRTEPNLFNKIQVNEEDDIVEKIRAALDPAYKKPNTNYSDAITAPAPFNEGAEQAPEADTEMYSEISYESSAPAKDDAIRERMSEIDDVSPEDYEALTFQPAKIDLLKTPTEQVGYSSIYGDEEVSMSSPKLRFTKEEAANILQKNAAKYIGKKTTKLIQKEYGALQFENSLLGDNDMTISTIKRGNKVIGLQGETSTLTRKKRYDAGLDLALPTPQKYILKTPVTTVDSSTSPRGSGRPSNSSYKTVSKKLIGELTNSYDL